MNIRQIQDALDLLGYGPINNDGVSGPATQEAVKKFQGQEGLTDDGIPGPLTEAKLLDAVAAGRVYKPPDKVPAATQTTGTADAAQYLRSDGCYHIPRGVDVRLSKNLMAHEVVCQGKGCCSESIISKWMVETYQDIRDEYGDAIEIATAGGSGYRCDTHNREVSGAAGSLHKLGCAFDMHCRDKPKLLRIVERKITDGEIGVYSTFIHGGVWNRGYVNRFTGK